MPTENIIRTVRGADRAGLGRRTIANVSISGVRSSERDGRVASLRRCSDHRVRSTRSSGAGYPRLRSGRLSMIAMMQAADVRTRDNLARGRRLDNPAQRRILAQRQMRSPVLVVVDVRSQDALQ